MKEKFKSPPINELVIGVYFNPPLINMRSEHVGLFWSTIREDFPKTTNNPPIPISGMEIIGEGEVFPMPRFWFESKDGTMLLQIQKNAFLINWRKRESNYPHFDNVKKKFDEYYLNFIKFLKSEIRLDEVYIDLCELTYINVIGKSNSYEGIKDTRNIIPIFPSIDEETKDALLKVIYVPRDNININITIQNTIRNNDEKENVLYYELRALGKSSDPSKISADEWFKNAHDDIGERFLNMTSPDAQQLWNQ